MSGRGLLGGVGGTPLGELLGEEPAAMFLVELSLRSPRLFWLPLFFRDGDLSSSRLPRDVSLQGKFSG